MTATKLPSEILPVDSRGRVRVSRERREQLLDEFEQSGLSGAQFARTVGLNYQTFAFWRQERQKRKPALSGSTPARGATTVQWLETVVDKANAACPLSSSAVVVRLPSGAAIEIAHASQAAVAAALLRAWEKNAC
jgi:transposase-like protein